MCMPYCDYRLMFPGLLKHDPQSKINGGESETERAE